MSQPPWFEGSQLSTDELIALLAGYKLLPQLHREWLIDQALLAVDCSDEELNQAREQFYTENKLPGEAEKQAWCHFYRMSPLQLDALAVRQFKLERFKQQKWGKQIETYFLQNKSKFDQVIYSLLRSANPEVARELYFRIKAGEQSFADLARAYSEGPEAHTGGLVGPVPLSQAHPALAQLLLTSRTGDVTLPTPLGEWMVIARVEKWLPAQLDPPMRQRLLDEQFEAWIQLELTQSSLVVQPSLAL